MGIEVAKSTVEKYRRRPRKPSSPTWKVFLKNHVNDLIAMDFFVVPTMTYKILFVLVFLVHERRRVVHFNITEHPTAPWTAQQVVDAFPWDKAPGTCSGIAIASMVTPFGGECDIWASRK